MILTCKSGKGGKARQGPARPGKARRQGHLTDSLNVGKKMKQGWHFRIILLGNSSTSHIFWRAIYFILFFFRGRFFFGFLVLCFPVSLIFCFSASLLFCFSAFLLLCFLASLLFAFPASAFPASLLLLLLALTNAASQNQGPKAKVHYDFAGDSKGTSAC